MKTAAIAILPFVCVLTCVSCTGQATTEREAPGMAAWRSRAANVTITRDDWGIPHVHGKTDADAVFGVIYAQAEDDFNRIETNYLNALGRLAEAEGESAVYRDLRMKLFVDPGDMRVRYETSPEWLRKLTDAWADGLNYYLATHPQVKPRAIARFEPWMALAFSEGSIGGDIERIDLGRLEAFYAKVPPSPPPDAAATADQPREPTGSNGIAVAPSRSATGHALLLINPHTSFFFRAEAQMSSDAGLNAYGAMTWGQFFVYQGFNEHAGWMHTSSGVDNIDEYVEDVVTKGDRLYYRVGNDERPLTTKTIVVPYKTPNGTAQKQFTVYWTHRGPIVREADGKWISVRLMQEPVKALTQSYLRTKANGYKAFRETMDLHTNSSNNTIFADASGNIAYFHANFIPRRDPRFDWRRPVDGRNPVTEWKGVLSIDESPALLNPPSGWLYNSNDPPWSAAGPGTFKPGDFPSYVDTGSPNPRGPHAIRLFSGQKLFTLDSFLAAAYDSYLPEFERLIPALVAAYDRLPERDALRARLAEQVQALREWDYRWNPASVATTLAVQWGDELWRRTAAAARRAGVTEYDYLETRAAASDRLAALAAVSDRLAADFGTWRTPWGELNRLQRRNGDIEQTFDDKAPSVPVGFTSARWGSLASFGARTYDGTKRMYGTGGNSFVAIVEFGDRVRARAISVGGESGDPSSPHFNDQTARYATGDLRDVYFYPEQLKGHTERVYSPGVAPR